MEDQVQDLDLGADVEVAPVVPNDLGSAERAAFRIWDGRRCVMRRLSVARSRQIKLSAMTAHKGDPHTANEMGTDEAVKASMESVGNLSVGPGGSNHEHLWTALSDKGRESAAFMWRLMNMTTPEEDAAFLVSIEVL